MLFQDLNRTTTECASRGGLSEKEWARLIYGVHVSDCQKNPFRSHQSIVFTLLIACGDLPNFVAYPRCHPLRRDRHAILLVLRLGFSFASGSKKRCAGRSITEVGWGRLLGAQLVDRRKFAE